MTTPANGWAVASTNPPAHKPGVKTTEFWLTIAVDVAAFAGTLANVLPDRWAAIAATVSTTGYAVSRGITKSGAAASG